MKPVAGGDQAQQRLQHLYAVSKLFASFETIEDTFDPALVIAAGTLPLRSAILIEAETAHSQMVVWPGQGRSPAQMRAARRHAESAYTYLVGSVPSDASLRERPGKSMLPVSAVAQTQTESRFIVIPIVVAHQPPFGVLQVEGAQPFDEMDLMFVNAIANQLATALDRDRAWGRDITRRQVAEQGRGIAERRGATSEHARVLADMSRVEYQSLAIENAQLYEQSRKAVAMRDQILAVVSHDLRSPLGIVSMAATALLEISELKDDHAEIPKLVGRIQRASERMLRLIEDLLDFASIESGNLAIKRQPHDMASMLSETLAAFEGVATDRGLQLVGEVVGVARPVSCDRDRIIQVLSNLVGNASKVAPNGGRISVTIETRTDDVLISVADSGPGISEADLTHLFERYWRSPDAQYKGTGLGLAIAHGIVVAHDGRIWVESVLGQGATFFFTLPLVPMGVVVAN